LYKPSMKRCWCERTPLVRSKLRKQHSATNTQATGCNEQELGILWQFFSDGTLIHAQPSNPRVADVLQQMEDVLQALRKFSLTRIHVHTLAFQVR
jgi:hypothetical protein